MRHDGPVVVALDGLPRGGRTLDWGVDEAARRSAPVVLVRAYQDPVEATGGWNPLIADPSVLGEAKEYLDAQQDVVRRRRPDVVVSTLLLHGPAVPLLREESEGAQLLVVGTGGRGAGHRVGSVAAHLAAHARCPVAVVRPVPHVPWTDEDDFVPPAERPVVVGVDGSPASLEAAHVAAAAAASRGVVLELVHARPTTAAPFGRVVVPPLLPFDESDPTHHAALQVADRLRIAHPGLEVRTVLVVGDPAHVLADAGRHAQLLVVGSRGTGAFRGMLLGSVSSHTVRAAACTVLVVHGVLED